MKEDYYGRLLTVGTPVAFNYQGYVRIGQVIKIKPNTDRMGRQYPKIYGDLFIVSHIRSDGSTVESKIRNIDGIVSLVL